MTDDLDMRIALRVKALVAEAPLAPNFERLAEFASPRRPRAPGPRRTAILVGAAVVIVAVVIAVLASMRTSDRVEPARRFGVHGSVAVVPLGSVPEGVSPRTLGSTPVFLVRHGDTVTTFLTDPHGTPGLHVLYWCPKEEAFVEPAHAEAFDIAGRIIGGPPQRGLDRLKTVVNGGNVRVALDRVIQGSTARYDRDSRARTQPGSYELPGIGATPWNSGPDSFCNGAVIGGR
jgi:hypothetical protein